MDLEKINFWKRLEDFVKNIQVDDMAGQEERDMIHHVSIEMQKLTTNNN